MEHQRGHSRLNTSADDVQQRDGVVTGLDLSREIALQPQARTVDNDRAAAGYASGDVHEPVAALFRERQAGGFVPLRQHAHPDPAESTEPRPGGRSELYAD